MRLLPWYHQNSDLSTWKKLSELICGSYSRSRYELENKCVIHSGCVVVVWSLVESFVEFDCCVNCSRVAWLVVVR